MDNILIVEDEKFIRQGIRVMIERSERCRGRIVECKNGQEALDILAKQSFDLILSDIKMPGMDGIELIKRLKEQNNHTPVVMITGYDDFSFAVEALRNNVRDYLLKPVDREQLYRLLHEIDAEQGRELEAFMADESLSREERIGYAAQYMRQNYSSNINMAMMSNLLSMNYTVFSELFKEIIGVNFVDYLRSIRLEAAKQLLSDTKLKISRVAERCGFGDEKHFLKCFRGDTGMTPSEYRSEHSVQLHCSDM